MGRTGGSLSNGHVGPTASRTGVPHSALGRFGDDAFPPNPKNKQTNNKQTNNKQTNQKKKQSGSPNIWPLPPFSPTTCQSLKSLRTDAVTLSTTSIHSVQPSCNLSHVQNRHPSPRTQQNSQPSVSAHWEYPGPLNPPQINFIQ